jgi:YHS domain-containing protein
MRYKERVAHIVAAALAAGVVALAAAEVLAAPAWFADGKDAIAGADPVAYFTDGKAVIGRKDITHDWMGVTWHFASAAHRDEFAKTPEKYAPQYDGFCAWAVSQGYTAKVDPQAWKIVDGKLYLNYNSSIQSRWSLDASGNITKANANWPGIKDKLLKK